MSKKIRYFFIVGSGRCGTYLLRYMLNLHPTIGVANETHFIPTLIRMFGKNKISYNEFFEVIEQHTNSSGSYRWMDVHIVFRGHSPDTFREDFTTFLGSTGKKTVREFIEAFFNFCYGEQIDVLGDKSHEYGMYMSQFLEVWPDAKFIHLVRDGRYAATSMQKHPGLIRAINEGLYVKITDYEFVCNPNKKSYCTNPPALLQCIQHWQRIVNHILQEYKKIPPDAYLEVRYEDLILCPVHELRRIAKFLGVKTSLCWLVMASKHIKPFSLWKEKKRIGASEYNLLTKEAASTLRACGYSTRPYRFSQLIRILHGLQEAINFILYRVVIPNLLRVVINGKKFFQNFNQKMSSF